MYFDEILVYSPTHKAHLQYLQEVLNLLWKEKLYAIPKKCSFMADSLTFLGYVVSFECLIPCNIHEVQNFYGPTSFYRQLIQGFSSLMEPITDYMKGRSL